MKIIFILPFVILYKFFYNLNNFIRTDYYYRKYSKYVCDSESPAHDIIEVKDRIISLIKLSGQDDFYIQRTVATGLGFAAHNNTSVLENLDQKIKIGDVDIPRTILSYLARSRGVYIQRIKESFSVFYWVNRIVFLPQYFISYLNFNSRNIKVIKNTANSVYWIIVLTLLTLLYIYHVPTLIIRL